MGSIALIKPQVLFDQTCTVDNNPNPCKHLSMEFSSLLLILLVILAIALSGKYRSKVKYFRPIGRLLMRGKTVIVTGANSGIGFETAAELARQGARVILACRDLDKGREAARLIVQRLTINEEGVTDVNHRVIARYLDLSNLKSVRAFAYDILATESHLEVLINNAGQFGHSSRVETEDGLETTMASNHLGHFLLTNLLLPLLKKSAPARVIVVTSWAHAYVPCVNLANINSEKFFTPLVLYCETKLANLLFVHQLAKQLDGSQVIVNAVHPGLVDTGLYRELGQLSRLLMIIFTVIIKLFGKTAEQGAQTSIFLAVSDSPDAQVNGRYFYNCEEIQPKDAARDDLAAMELWDLSSKLTGFAEQ